MLDVTARRAAADDGKQVVTERSSREEKYPARLANNPLYPIAAADGGLHVNDIDGQVTLDHTTYYPPHESQTQKQGISHMTKLICTISIVMLLVIVGACVGGILGSRKTKATSSQGFTATTKSPSPSPRSTAIATASARAHATSSSPPSPRGTSIRKAYNGTSFASVSYPHSKEQNDLLFYQLANGDIRKAVYNQSRWHASTHVTDDARLGSGLAASWTGKDPDQMIWLYYIDKTHTLQVLQGHHASDNWTHGSLGSFNFKASPNFSALSMEFVGGCDSGINAWLCYQTSDGTVRQVWWNTATDSWRVGLDSPNIKPGSQFVTYNRNDYWRVFMVDKNSRLVHYYCDTCCKDVEWKQGITYDFPREISSPDGIGAIEIGYPILHYQSSNGTLRVLNGSYDVRHLPIQSLPGSWGKAMLGTKMAVADGAIFGQPMKLFYQINGSDITATTWDQSSPAWNTTLQLDLGD